MRSSELAGLAGVTVRTLRHYHQLGVLPEPARSANGYRDYDARDLVRLLRAKRLAGLGVPLERVASMLGEADPRASRDVLAQLDDELARRMDDLRRQRELLAQVRESGSDADLPAAVGRYLAQLDRRDVAAPLRASERDHAVLVHHLLGDDVADPLLVRFTAALDEQPELAARVLNGFAGLTDASADDDVNGVVDLLVRLVLPIVTELADALPGSHGGADVIDSLHASTLNATQREAIRRTGERLSEPSATA